MSGRRALGILIVVCGGGWLGTETGIQAEEKANGTIRLAVVSSLMQDNSRQMVSAFLEPFGKLVQTQTGLNSQVVLGETAAKLAGQLCADKVHLAVFQGVEFAWVRDKHPELKPLMIAINQKQRVKAFLVVPASSKATGFADLKGKSIGLPKHSRIHSRLFLEQGCHNAGEPDIAKFLGKLSTPANAEEALDDLVDGSMDALVVNGVALESYERRKPGRFAKLKVIQTSETFPPSVIAYRPGCLEPEKLKQFQQGLLNAHQTAVGRQLMTLWRLTAFEMVPTDFEDLSRQIVKYYPVPKALE